MNPLGQRTGAVCKGHYSVEEECISSQVREERKPKFCPFRLSTVNFLGPNQPDKKIQSFSLVFEDCQLSFDLIYKDKEQAESLCVGLTALVSASNHPRTLANVGSSRWVQNCANSPVSYIMTTHKPGILQSSTRLAKVRSLYGSPARSLLDKHLSDRMLNSADEFYSPRQRTLSDIQSYLDKILPRLPHLASYTENDKTHCNPNKGQRILTNSKLSSSELATPRIYVNDGLKDVFIWGKGVGGGIFGCDIDASFPKLLDSNRALDVRSVSCGENHAALVTKQGEVFCWGLENGGRLGHKINMDVPYPKIVDSLTGICVQKVVCGAHCTFAITNSGELYAWGDSDHGLGISGDGGSKSQWFPHKIVGPLDGICISKISCGKWHTAIVSSSGQLFTYGDGTFGVLGHGNVQSIPQPKEVESLRGLHVKSVACGPWHTAAVVEIMVGSGKSISPGGKLFTCGDNDKGRLGHPGRDRKLIPTCVASLVDCDFIQVSCGTMLTAGLTVTGMVFTMGSSINGQLGNPQAEDFSITRVEGLLRNEFVKEISVGFFHVAVLTTKGKVYVWGRGGNGQLGLGDNRDRNSPTLVEALEDRNIESISCGSNFTVVTCPHKFISSKDQLICTACRTVFGFGRKRHNCYNCGLIFCNSCSSKKIMNAASAPNKCKKCRVCDACFIQIQKILDPRTNMEVSTPRPLLLAAEGYTNLIVNREQSSIHGEKTLLKLTLFDESTQVGADPDSVRVKMQSLQLRTQVTTTRRWGHVPCPLQFLEHVRENSLKIVPVSGHEISDILPVHVQNPHLDAKLLLTKPGSLRQNSDNIDKILKEELRRLQTEAISLTQKCQSRNQKLQQYKQKIEETWSLAKDEAEKCKAANAVIKILSSQMNALTEKLSAKKPLNISRTPDAISTQSKVLEPKDEQLVSSCTKQNIDTSESIKHQTCTSSLKDVPIDEATARNSKTRESKDEQVEQVEVGVYITFISLPSGQKGLKRVRFSRKHFGEKEAEIWWEDNQKRIYSKYNIERIVTSSTDGRPENHVNPRWG